MQAATNELSNDINIQKGVQGIRIPNGFLQAGIARLNLTYRAH